MSIKAQEGWSELNATQLTCESSHLSGYSNVSLVLHPTRWLHLSGALWSGQMTSMTEFLGFLIWVSEQGRAVKGLPRGPLKVKADGTNDKEQYYHAYLFSGHPSLFIWPSLRACGFPHQGLNCTQPSFSDNESSL